MRSPRREGHDALSSTAPPSPFQEDPFHLGPGEVGAPDPHLPAVCPERDGDERRKEFQGLGLCEVVGYYPAPPPERLRFYLHPLPGAHVLDGESPEYEHAPGCEHPADLRCQGETVGGGQVAGEMNQEDHIKHPIPEGEVAGIAQDKLCRRRRGVPAGEEEGLPGDLDRNHVQRASGERRQGLSVPAADFKDSGIGGDLRERRRGSSPEAPPPAVVLVPRGWISGHGSEVDARRHNVSDVQTMAGCSETALRRG